MNKNIPYVNLIKQTKEEKKEIFYALNKLFLESEFILGKEVEKFEKNICKLLNIKRGYTYILSQKRINMIRFVRNILRSTRI